MHSISSTNNSNLYLASSAAQTSTQNTSKASSTETARTSGSGSDSFQLSPDGRDLLQTSRIALNEQAGNITSDQATTLYSQVSATQAQVAADKLANSGTLNAADVQGLETVQNQIGQQIYSAAHNGATPPSTAPVTSAAELRNMDEYARIGLNRNAGNLTQTQASTLDSQVQATYQRMVSDRQGNNGSMTQAEALAVNRTQSALSTEITSLSSGAS